MLEGMVVCGTIRAIPMSGMLFHKDVTPMLSAREKYYLPFLGLILLMVPAAYFAGGGCRPKPVVPPPVVVVPPEVKDGPRQVVLLRETEETSVEQAQLIVKLRTGYLDTYMSSKGHMLLVLDDDLPAAGPFLAAGKGKQFLIYDGDNLLHSGDLPDSPEVFLATLKAHGG